ncbi:MAG: hypothetical protein ACO32J_08395 [Phycisphaerales bacterium]
MAPVTASKLASGSPMPMKTTWLIRSTPSSLPSRQTCSTILPRERLPSSPPMPLAQNRHPTGQPTWLDTQAVRRASAGIITHSVRRSCWPATGNVTVPGSAARGQPISSFWVPSVASWCVRTSPCSNTISLASIARADLDRLVMAAASLTPRP